MSERDVSKQIELRIERLVEDLAGRGSVLVAYSGGVDSGVVAALAYRAVGERALALTAAAETLAGAELDQARRLAAEIGIRHETVTYSELDDPEFVANPSHRCYVCQGMRMDRMLEEAEARGYATVCDGTNASDPGPDRPGLRAIQERAIYSPLYAHGVDKETTRAIGLALGLSVWDRPANACLSSRIPHGQLVTLGKLRRIEAAEEILIEAGFRVVRVRHDGPEAGAAARVEVAPGEVGRLAELWDELEPRLRALGFSCVAYDPQGYRRGGAGSPPHRLHRPRFPRVNTRRLEELLEAVAAGGVSTADALRELADLPYADLGFAKLDLHRELRSGLPEAVYAEGKRTDDLKAIVDRMLQAHGRVLLTRVRPDSAAELTAAYPEAVYHERARILTCGEPREPLPGTVAVLAAGTSDLPVAEEAAVCLAWFGHEVERCYDVGIAGLHRLLGNLPAIRKADVIVAVAGMDGALPTVVAGLVTAPVVAVPTSVGYGASFGGVAALLTMLNACAPGIGVVNIDNGYGAAVLASRIARRSTSIASP